MALSFQIIMALTGCRGCTVGRPSLILKGRGRFTNTQGTKPSWKNPISFTRIYTGTASTINTGSTPMIRVDRTAKCNLSTQNVFVFFN